MENQFNLENGSLKPLTKDVAEEIAQWEYETPYEAYSIKGHHDEYLMDESTWGIEQFCLVGGGAILGQVSCQYEGDDLWVGWSMAPQFCGKGNGAAFVGRCVDVGAVLGRHSGAPVDEHQVTHNHFLLPIRLAIHEGQDSGESF